eukprot:2700196-Prymnesium_polylepis.2
MSTPGDLVGRSMSTLRSVMLWTAICGRPLVMQLPPRCSMSGLIYASSESAPVAVPSAAHR